MISRLRPGATSCVECFVHVKRDDKILIITDNTEIAEALAEASKKAGGEVAVYYLPNVLRPIERLSGDLRDLILKSNVIFTPFDIYDKESTFRKEIVDLANVGNGRKIAHMPSVTPEMFTGTGMLSFNPVEMQKMKEITEKLAILLTAVKKVKITAATGTNLNLDLVGWNRSGIVSTGHIMEGSWGNLPSGEAFVLPKMGTANGKIVVDRAISYVPENELPVTIHVTTGSVEIDTIEGGESLKNLLKEHSSRLVCELGIGTNPKRAIDHALVEIEKMLRTIHIGIGGNVVFGGDNEAPIHIDMVISTPNVLVNALSNEKEPTISIIENGTIREDRIDSIFNINYENFSKEMRGDTAIFIKQGINVEDKGEFLFCWDEIPGNHYAKLIEYLRNDFCINWFDAAKIEKTDNGSTIKVSKEDNFFTLVLKNGKTKVNLEINDGRTAEFFVKRENGKLNIYKGDDMLYRCWQDHRGHKLRLPVGDAKTAKKLIEVWHCIESVKQKNVGNIIREYNKIFKGDSTLVYQLLNTLKIFGIIEFPFVDERSNLG